MRLPARNFATSSKNDTEMSKKKVKRGNTSSMSSPAATQSSAYCTAELSVKAIDSAGVAPACCMCCPTTESGFQRGTCCWHQAMWSVRIVRAPGSAIRKNMWLATKCERKSLWFEVPVIERQSTPLRLAAESMNASSVNGEGSFIAHEVRARSTPARQVSMCSVLLTTTPQVPRSSASTSSMS